MIQRRLLTPLALLTGATVTAATVGLALFSIIGTEKDLFHAQVQQVRDVFSVRLGNADEAIHGLASLFNASTHVDADEFRISTEEILRRHPYIDTVSYFPLVSAQTRAAFEQEMRNDGYVTFSINGRNAGKYAPMPEQERYFPAMFVEPFSPASSHEIGFDALAEPLYQEAIRAAIAGGKAVASYAIIGEHGREVMLFKALYAGKGTPVDESERLATVNGLLGARINIHGLMAGIKKADHANIALSLDQGPGMTTTVSAAESEQADDDHSGTLTQLAVYQELPLAGQHVSFSVTKDIRWPAANPALLIAMALMGIGVAVLVYVLARVLVRRAEDLEERNIVIARQVTEQTRELDLGHRYLENILGSMADALFVIDPEHRIQRVNSAATALLGQADGNLNNTDMCDLFADPVELERVCGALMHDGTVRNCEVRLRRGPNDTTPVSLSAAIMHDEAGTHIGTVLAAQDISARAEAQAALAAKNAELERINAHLDQFAYVISHDLKAPLRAIENLSKWIAEDLGDSLSHSVRQHMDLMSNRVHRMEALINGVLAYSRAGRVDNEEVDVDIGQMLADIKDSMPVPPGYQIIIHVGMPQLHTAATPLSQVFSNLISNAIKYRSRDDGKVDITVRDAGRFYEFAVTDDGPGVAAEHHERIFGIFQTLDSKRSDSTGVGLALVKKIVESQGGTIIVESAPRAGATFRFTWPKQAAEKRRAA